MKLLLILLLLAAPLVSTACSCSYMELTAVDIRSSGYVALVKIKEQLPFDAEKYRDRKNRGQIQYEVTVDEIVLFKGPSQQKITVYGAPPNSTTIQTSCDTDVSAGQEWLIISNMRSDGGVTISMCGQSILYKNSEGFRDWQYARAEKRLALVRETLTQPSLNTTLDAGKPVLYYPNGQIERSISYRNKRKHGAALYYYPDGTLYGRTEYRKDSLHGKRIWYDKKGNIQSRATYNMGIPIDTMITYMYPNVPSYITIRSSDGVLQKSLQFQGDIETRSFSYLYQESFYKNDRVFSNTYYRQNGTIRSRVLHHDRGSTEESFDELGNLLRKREFNKEGRVVVGNQ